MTLPQPECKYGYTEDQLQEILGSRFDEFTVWMNGQTMTICDGQEYSHELQKYVPTECLGNAHGHVVYPWDLKRFLDGRTIID